MCNLTKVYIILVCAFFPALCGICGLFFLCDFLIFLCLPLNNIAMDKKRRFKRKTACNKNSQLMIEQMIGGWESGSLHQTVWNGRPSKCSSANYSPSFHYAIRRFFFFLIFFCCVPLLFAPLFRFGASNALNSSSFRNSLFLWVHRDMWGDKKSEWGAPEWGGSGRGGRINNRCNKNKI